MLDLGFALWLMVLTLMPAPATAPKDVEFARDVQPILQKRCSPCHFPGGTMHAKLPFDRGATIDKLGTKLFTRIKRDDEQAVIRAFLARKK